jgi:hypothetical protein
MQGILPPLADPFSLRLWQKVRVWGKARLVGLCNFALDDSAYRRAQHGYPNFIRHWRPQSTFASAEIMLPA